MSIFLALVCLLAAAGVARAGDPRRVWKTIESKHFVIHYYEPLGDVATRVAFAAERSHALLAPVFGHEPTEKTQVVIVDDTDGANGFANVLPRNAIRIFATAPTTLSTLNDHDDWLFGLTAHEYTHVLHLDSIGGLPRLVNKVFGKIWAPNQVQPRWLIEGIATYQESKQSSSGRVRSSIFDMNLRTATLAGGELDLDEVSNAPRAWPRGNAAYLYGSHFLDYVFSRYGDDALRTMSWSYGSNPIPYSLNRTIKRITGKGFDELYQDWRQHLRYKYSMQLETVERRGLREGRRLTANAEVNADPSYSADGKYLVWRQSDGYSQNRFRAMPVGDGSDAGAAWDYVTIHRSGGYDLFADGSMLAEQTSTYRSNYDYQDLVRWDRRSKRLERLTYGLRARDPALSPDEGQVAFVINDRSQSRLALMPVVPQATPRILWEGARFDQAGAPCWSPDGRFVAFSAWTTGGFRDILLVDVGSGKVEHITHDRAVDADPVFSPDGAYLYYVSDRSGIYNVYALDRSSGKTYQVTNVVGSAFAPDVSPDGTRMVYQGFVVGGYDLFEIVLDPASWLEPLPYVNDRPDAVVVPEDPALVSSPRPYRPLETLAPQSYNMQLATSSFGQALSVQTGGNDAVGLHAYNLGATISWDRPDINVAGVYSYHGWWPSLRIAAARDSSRRAGLIIDGINTVYTRETYSLTASLGLPVLRTDNGAAQLSVDYDLDWLVGTETEFGGHDPNDMVPQFPALDATAATLSMRFGYSDSDSFVYSVGPQEGQSFSASLGISHSSLGSDFSSLLLSYRWEAYKKLPWGKSPVLALRLAGGIRAAGGAQSSMFVLGGAPEQDVVQSIIDSSRAGSTGFLRGYRRRSMAGFQFHLANLEYRHRLFDFERGLSSLPFYVRRLHVAGLLDVGNAFVGDLEPLDLNVGVGGALRLDLFLGYFIPGSLEIGYARGLSSGGIGEYWMLLTGTL